MKNMLLLISILFIAACSEREIAGPIKKDTLTHKAYHWYGLEEQKDRQLLKQITGVDPVQTEWCAAFVNMVLLSQNLPQSSTVSAYPLTARSFLLWGDTVKDSPQQGDILVFKRGEPWQGHVGFYVNHRVVNGQIQYYVLGGNQNDSVSIDVYPGDRLIGIRRLKQNQTTLLASVY